jgi:uroporphyrinogen III methyltransferase/synthase
MNGTTPSQKVITGTLENIVNITEKERIKPPAITIIGNVVKLSEKLNWFSKKPLSGKKILVTRDKNQAYEFSKKLQRLGAETIEEPFIEIEDNSDHLPEIDLSEYKVILFNSANGVKYFFKRIDDSRKLANIIIGVIGERTAKELKKYRIIADFLPEKFTVENLIHETLKYVTKGDKVLIVTSNVSPVDITELHRRHEITFEKLEIYKTRKLTKSEKEMDALFANKIDIITLLSSSTVESFFNSAKDHYSDFLRDIKIASIGPETSKTIKKHGYKVAFEAEKYTMDGLISILLNYATKS